MGIGEDPFYDPENLTSIKARFGGEFIAYKFSDKWEPAGPRWESEIKIDYLKRKTL